MTDQIALEEQIQTFNSAIKRDSTVINEEFEDFDQETLDYHGLEGLKSSLEAVEAFIH